MLHRWTKKIFAHLEKGHSTDQIIRIFYRLRKSIFKHKYASGYANAVEKFLRLPPSDNPLFYCRNPLLVCYFIHFTLSKFNTRVKDSGNTFSELSQRFLDLTVKMVNKFDQSTLDVYVFLPCHRRKNFLDFLLKRFCPDLLSIRYIQNAIEKAWNFNGHSEMILEYYANTTNRFHQFFGKTKGTETRFKLQDPSKTKSALNFDYFNNSQNIKVINQILNAMFLIVYEAVFIYHYKGYFQTDYASGSSLYELIRENSPGLLYFGLIFKASIFFDTILKIMLFNFKELPKVLVLYIFKALIIAFQTIFLLAISTGMISEQYYIISNMMYFIMYIAIIEILTNIIFIVITGNYLLMFAQACVLIFNIMMVSIPCFVIVAHFLAQLFLGYHDDFNNFTNIYYSMMKIYEYTFGAVIYTDKTSAYAVLLNILLIIISYIGNVMLVNMLILFIDDKFSGILLKSSYRTLKAKYKLKKITVDNKADFLFLIPLNSTLFFAPIVFLSFLPKYKAFCSRMVKIISHFLIVVIPLAVGLLCFNILMLPFHVIEMFADIGKQAYLDTKSKVKVYLKCILYGFPVILLLNLVDNFNVLRVVTGSWSRYPSEENDKISLPSEEETRIKFDGLKFIYKKLKQMNKKGIKEKLITKQDLILEIFEDVNYTAELDDSNQSGVDTSTELGAGFTQVHREKIRLGVYNDVIKRFSRHIDNTVDIRLLKKFLKKHLKNKEIDLILNYDFDKLEDAWKMMIMEELGDLHRTVNKVLRTVNVISEDLRYKKGDHAEDEKCSCPICNQKSKKTPFFKQKG